MLVGRRIGILLAMAVGLVGCRAGGTGSLTLLPRRNPSPSAFDLDAFVAEHNRNAGAIDSLESRPSIKVAMGRLSQYQVSVNGKMALERPRNFKLEVDAEGVRQADIGSNAEEFWYWVANPDKEQKYVYWCNYRDLESSDLPITRQPDWIIEAMGLKPITPKEAATIQVHRGPESGTTVLTFPAARDGGERHIREMVVSNGDLRLKRLRIMTDSPRTVIAEAQPSEYQNFPTEPKGGAAREDCYLPQKLRLDWKREHLVLDVALHEVSVNQFDHAKAADIFVEPEMPGYSRLNLAELNRGERNPRRPRTRQSIPPPDARDDIHLGRPAPMKDDDPIVPKVGRKPPRPNSGEDSGPTTTLDELVGAPLPQPPGSGPIQSASLPGLPGRDSTVEQ